MISKHVNVFLILLLVIPLVRAQSVPSEASAADAKKAQAEREKKGLALVDEITNELPSLKLPENRIRIGIGLAGVLWSRDEKRAVALFKDAAAGLSEITEGVNRGDPEYENQSHLPQQLRQEMVQLAAKYDARLAVDFLRTTRTESNARPPGLTNMEAQLGMRVAIQIAAKDPNEALSVAGESLKLALDYSALELLYSLHSQHKPLAERFLEDILNGIRTYGIGNNSATPIAMTLLRTWIENNRAAKDPAAPRTTNAVALSNLNEATARELWNIVINALFDAQPKTVAGFGRFSHGPSTLYPGMLQGMLQELKPMLPELERLAPDRMSDLRIRIVEAEKSYEAQQPWVRYQELTRTGTPEAIMEAARTAPAELADSLIHQASWKAINQGDDVQARKIIEHIANPEQRTQLKRQLARQSFYRAREQKKLDEARALLSGLPLEEQMALLAQLASFAASEDKPVAHQLLAEAESLLSGRAANYGQLQAHLQIAAAYQALDANKSTVIVERVIDQVNELVAAALVLNGFDVQGYFRAGEFIITGGNPLNMLAQECGRILASNSNNDLDHARLAAERFQRPEMRLIALVQIAEAALPRRNE